MFVENLRGRLKDIVSLGGYFESLTPGRFKKATVELPDRQLVEAFVQRIEVDPNTKTGRVILYAGLEHAYREGSTRVPRGDFMGRIGNKRQTALRGQSPRDYPSSGWSAVRSRWMACC